MVTFLSNPKVRILQTMPIVQPNNPKPDIGQSEWPLPAYIRAWKAFREVSNEPDAIAGHLVRRAWVPRNAPINILDVGTGDGAVLRKVLHLCSTAVQDVVAVDPNPDFLAEARTRLSDSRVAGEIKYLNKKIEDVDREIIKASDVVLFIHVIYLTDVPPLMNTLKAMKSGACCYVVFDADDSIFTRLWQRTAAPVYLDRVRRCRKAIEQLSNNDWEIQKTTIHSEVKNPCRLRPVQVSELVKSLLCYTDVEDMDAETLNWVDETLENAARFGPIQCTCDCYEIIKK